jgi:hypothetical protein
MNQIGGALAAFHGELGEADWATTPIHPANRRLGSWTERSLRIPYRHVECRAWPIIGANANGHGVSAV